MKLLKPFIIYFSFVGFFSCDNKQKVKIVSRYDDGNVQETYAYSNSSDSLSYLDTKYHDNGKILFQGHIEKGKQEGPWIWYFPNGRLRDSATYRSGEFIGRRVHWDSLGRLTKLEIISGPCYDCCCDGIVISYYPNGKPQNETHMYKGKEHGKDVYYYDNGQPKKEQYFSDGIKEGKYYEWHANGKQWVTGFFRQGKMDSIWTWFDTTGKVESIQELKKGELVRDIK